MANPTEQPTKPAAAKSMQWIINNTGRALAFPRKPVPSTVKGSSPTIDGDVLTLEPGANLVACKRWEQLKAEDPDRTVDDVPVKGEISRLLVEKIPRAEHHKRQQPNEGKPHLVEGPKVASKSAPLDGLTDAETTAVVEEIANAVMLRSLIAVEKRPHVLVMLNRNLSGLHLPSSSRSAA